MSSFTLSFSETQKPVNKLSVSKVKAVVYILSLVLFISCSAIFYCNYEGWSPDIALGFAIVTLSTVGYGYHSPSDDNSRLFTIFFMLFGVYFVFAGINELIALRMEYVAKSLKKEAGSSGEKYINMRRSFVLNIMVIIGVLLAGAFVLVELEDWTFIKSLYFAIETTTTIGFGDLDEPGAYTRGFLCFYILMSCGLVTYAFSNLHLMNAGLRLLNEDEDRTQKRQNFEFLMNMDTGNGLTQAEFVLAILEQQGVVDRERDVMPWVEKFNALDSEKSGRLRRKELEFFHRQEAVLASSHLEEINRDRSSSVVDLPVVLVHAAERALRSPWTSLDEGPVRMGTTGATGMVPAWGSTGSMNNPIGSNRSSFRGGAAGGGVGGLGFGSSSNNSQQQQALEDALLLPMMSEDEVFME